MTKLGYVSGEFCYDITMNKDAKKVLNAKCLNSDLEVLLSDKNKLENVIDKMNKSNKGKAEILDYELFGDHLLLRVLFHDGYYDKKAKCFGVSEQWFRSQVGKRTKVEYQLPIGNSFLDFEEIDDYHLNKDENRLYIARINKN